MPGSSSFKRTIQGCIPHALRGSPVGLGPGSPRPTKHLISFLPILHSPPACAPASGASPLDWVKQYPPKFMSTRTPEWT